MSHSKIKTRIYEYLPFSLVHFMSFRGQGVPYYSFNWVKSLANFEKYINPPKGNYVMHYFDKYRMVFKERDKNYTHSPELLGEPSMPPLFHIVLIPMYLPGIMKSWENTEFLTHSFADNHHGF